MEPSAIFVAYRRADSADISGRICDRLAERFGAASVFRDVDSSTRGAASTNDIAGALAQTAVELVIIGPTWINAASGWTRRDAGEPDDLVRTAIETALRAGIPIIPLLVMGAVMPPAQRLPESLKPLTERNALHVRPDPDFHRDMERVIAAVEYWMAQPRPQPVASAPTLAPAAASSSPGATQTPGAVAPAKSRRVRMTAAIVGLALVGALFLGMIFSQGLGARPSSSDLSAAQQTASAQRTFRQPTATPTTPRLIAFPFTDPAPGPPGVCDRSGVNWTVNSGAASDFTCFADHTHIAGQNDELSWDGQPSALPANLSVSVQFSHLSANGVFVLKVVSDGANSAQQTLQLSATETGGRVDLCTVSACQPGPSFALNQQGTNTVGFFIQGTRLTVVYNGRTAHAYTLSKPFTPASVALNSIGSVNANASVFTDIANFTVKSISSS